MSTPTTQATDQTEATYGVSGMTCGHCVASVTAEVGKIDGVSRVDVDLASGKVTVTSRAPLQEAMVAEAVTLAGYELVPVAAEERPASSCRGTCH